MDIFLSLIIATLFILSFVGLLFPIIPSTLFIWGGFLVYHFFINGQNLTSLFWILMVVMTIILFVSDIWLSSHFVKRFGGSKRGEYAAAVAVLIGSFIIPPFGIIVLPFFVVLFVELFQNRTSNEAIRSAIGSLVGFLGSTFAKLFVQLIMILWFLFIIIF